MSGLLIQQLIGQSEGPLDVAHLVRAEGEVLEDVTQRGRAVLRLPAPDLPGLLHPESRVSDGEGEGSDAVCLRGRGGYNSLLCV